MKIAVGGGNQPEETERRPYLLLTAAVDARNGAACMFSKNERYRQYLHAFKWYMGILDRNSDLFGGLVFCENSEADLSEFRTSVPERLNPRVEFISLPMDGFRPERGKSYNEMRTLDLAMERTELLGEDDVFVKLTGRYPVRNIRRMVKDLRLLPEKPNVCYFRMRFNGRHPDLADTRCIAFRKSIWKKFFSGLYETADNATHRHFEGIVL